jgi:hypothetical protein
MNTYLLNYKIWDIYRQNCYKGKYISRGKTKYEAIIEAERELAERPEAGWVTVTASD